MRFVWKELQIIMSGELESARRLCQHLKAQEKMIRNNQSTELVASMREAGELAEALHHYETQRARWMEEHADKMQEIAQDSAQQDGFKEQLRTIGSTLKTMLREVHDRTVLNAELLARMVKRGQEILQEIVKANGMTKEYGPKGSEKTPSLFLDQRI